MTDTETITKLNKLSNFNNYYYKYYSYINAMLYPINIGLFIITCALILYAVNFFPIPVTIIYLLVTIIVMYLILTLLPKLNYFMRTDTTNFDYISWNFNKESAPKPIIIIPKTTTSTVS